VPYYYRGICRLLVFEPDEGQKRVLIRHPPPTPGSQAHCPARNVAHKQAAAAGPGFALHSDIIGPAVKLIDRGLGIDHAHQSSRPDMR
jgi:hypothetical protein